MLDGDKSGPPDAGGFAIGDLTGDGKNEIAATWYAAVYKWIAGGYRIIGFNPWIFQNGGGLYYMPDDFEKEILWTSNGNWRDQPM